MVAFVSQFVRTMLSALDAMCNAANAAMLNVGFFAMKGYALSREGCQIKLTPIHPRQLK